MDLFVAEQKFVQAVSHIGVGRARLLLSLLDTYHGNMTKLAAQGDASLCEAPIHELPASTEVNVPATNALIRKIHTKGAISAITEDDDVLRFIAAVKAQGPIHKGRRFYMEKLDISPNRWGLLAQKALATGEVKSNGKRRSCVYLST